MTTTSDEHSSVGPLGQVPSRSGDEPGVRSVGEEVSAGLAVTTGAGIVAMVGDEPGRARVEHGDGDRRRDGDGSVNEDGDGGDDANSRDEQRSDHVHGGVGPCGSVTSRRSLRLGSVRSGSCLRSKSNSRSRSSEREGLEMGESSMTSWTQADADADAGSAERPGSCEGRPSGEAYCRSSLDQPKLKEEKEVPREGAEEGVRDLSRKEETLVAQEEDIGEEWHPLRYTGSARSQHHSDGESEGEKGEREEDVGSVHALESAHGGDPSLETSEKEQWQSVGSSGRNARHLRLEFKRPSPQPWDEVDPATDNNEAYTSDYYSTLNSKKFEALQKSRRRPLIPQSTYYFGPPPSDAAYGTPPVGQIGVHHPREIVRIERDYVGGELVQFSPVFPLELEGRITPTQFLQTINEINEILISAYSMQHASVDNFLAVLTLQLSTLVMTSHYAKEMRRLKQKIEELNAVLYNPVGLRILWPQKVAFLFLEIEYY